MLITVLPTLETKDDWLNFFRREHPYCLVDSPSCLVDFQSTYLQLTRFNVQKDDALRYTLGSRTSLEPAWQLIKGCGWSLRLVMEGLESLNFNANVRDNAAFRLPSDLSVRKSFAREPRLQPFLVNASQHISPVTLGKYLRDEQYTKLHALSSYPLPNLHSLIISLSTEPERWQVTQQQDLVKVILDSQPLFQLTLTNTSVKRYLSSSSMHF